MSVAHEESAPTTRAHGGAISSGANSSGPDNDGDRAWYEVFYAGVDAMDPTVIDRLCTADTALRFANHEQIVGRAVVRASLEHFWTTISGLRHEFRQVVENGDHAIIEAIVHYTMPDGRVVPIPVSTAIDRQDGLIAAQRIYIDLAPLAQ